MYEGPDITYIGQCFVFSYGAGVNFDSPVARTSLKAEVSCVDSTLESRSAHHLLVGVGPGLRGGIWGT